MQQFKSNLVFLFIAILVNTGWGQNIVPNHSFETHGGTYYLYNGFTFPEGNVEGWGGFLTCDLHADGIGATSLEPTIWGYQVPYSGEAMAGIRAFSNGFAEWHEFIFAYLDEPLEAAAVYEVSFKISPSEGSKFATDDIGLCLTSREPPSTDESLKGALYYDRYSPQIENPEGRFLDDAEIWYEISGFYKAKGDEVYLIIGNFKPDSLTSQKAVWDVENDPAAYFFIDYVVVEKCPIPINVDFPSDTSICGASELVLDVTNDQATYLWDNDSTKPIRTIDKPGYYSVQISSGGCVHESTIEVKEIVDDLNLGGDKVVCEGSFLTLKTAKDKNATYLWNDTYSDRELRIEESGQYWVEASSGSCLFRDTISVDFLDEYTKLYPNPNNGVFKYESSLDQIDSYRLFESAGKLVGAEDNLNQLNVEFDIGSITASSLFILEVETSGCKVRKKIIVIPE